MSATGYIHKLQGGSDPTTTFLVQKLLSACHKLGKKFDLRMPINKPMLSKLLEALDFTVPGKHHRACTRQCSVWLSMPSCALGKWPYNQLTLLTLICCSETLPSCARIEVLWRWGGWQLKSFVPAGTCCRVVHVHNSTQIQAYVHTNIFSLREKANVTFSTKVFWGALDLNVLTEHAI